MSHEITQVDLASLATKLDGLDLTANERALLTEILERAVEPGEVQGFGYEGTVATGGFAPLIARIGFALPDAINPNHVDGTA